MIVVTDIHQREVDRPSGQTAASITLDGGPNPHHPDLVALGPCMRVAVDSHAGLGGWLVDAYVELADRGRTQWSVTKHHASRDDAAAEATAFFWHALDLLRRSIAGEAVTTPGQRLQRACDAAWEDSEVARDARERLAAANDQLREVKRGDSYSVAYVAQSRVEAARHALRDARSAHARAFFESHHWSDFTAATKPKRRPALMGQQHLWDDDQRDEFADYAMEEQA